MNDVALVNDAMIDAALKALAGSGISRPDVKRALVAAIAHLPGQHLGVRYDLMVNTTIDFKKARFIGVTDRRAYFRVETKDGKELTVHANDIQPATPRPRIEKPYVSAFYAPRSNQMETRKK